MLTNLFREIISNSKMDATEGKMWPSILVLTLWRHWSIWKEFALVTLVGVATPQLPIFILFSTDIFFSNNSGFVSTKTSNFFNWQRFSSLFARWDTIGFSLVSHWAEREVNYCLTGCIFQTTFSRFPHDTYFPTLSTRYIFFCALFTRYIFSRG